MPLHAAQLRVLALPPHWAHEADRHAESAHCLLRAPAARSDRGAGEHAGVRTSSSQSILCGALAKTASVISFINRRALSLARRNYPNNPASLILHPSALPDDNSGRHPDRRTNVRIRFSTEFAI
jgi:hypothetical protein